MVYSEDEIPRAEALVAQRRLVTLLSFKLNQEYSELCGFVRLSMSLVIARYNILLLHGPRDKEAQIPQKPELMGGVVMEVLVSCRG